MKYTNALMNYYSAGIAKRQIALITLRIVLQIPVPSIIAPMYLEGKTPPRLKTLLPTIPPTNPIKPIIGRADQSYPDPCGEYSDTKGNSMISTEFTPNMRLIFRL